MINDEETTGWGCDVPISMPEPISANDVLVDLGSHAITELGLVINMTKAVLQDTFAPTYAPPDESAQ